METQTANSSLATFDKLKADITLFVEPCTKIAVKNDEESKQALTAGKEVKNWLKKIEEKRKELVKPLNDQVDAINAYAKQIKVPLENAEIHIKKQLTSWEMHLEKIRQEEFKKAEEARLKAEAEAAARLQAQKEESESLSMFMEEKEVKKAEIVADVEAERARIEIEQQHKSATKAIAQNKVSGSRKVWTFEITDEDKVPREFLCVDEKKIRAAIKMWQDNGIIDQYASASFTQKSGVRVFQDTRISL